jgi:signal transduction histidine kinase
LGSRRDSITSEVEVISYVDPQIPMVLGDSTRLTQILTNLTSNAAKFTNSGFIYLTARLIPPGALSLSGNTITVKNKGKHSKNNSISGETIWIRFRCQDSGIGIRKESLKTLFE